MTIHTVSSWCYAHLSSTPLAPNIIGFILVVGSEMSASGILCQKEYVDVNYFFFPTLEFT